MLARLPEQQCNNVELFELFSETTQGEAFFYVARLPAADLDATSTDHGERAGPQVNWFRPGSRPALEHPVRCASGKRCPSAIVLVGTVEECASQSDRLKVVFYKVGIT